MWPGQSACANLYQSDSQQDDRIKSKWWSFAFRILESARLVGVGGRNVKEARRVGARLRKICLRTQRPPWTDMELNIFIGSSLNRSRLRWHRHPCHVRQSPKTEEADSQSNGVCWQIPSLRRFILTFAHHTPGGKVISCHLINIAQFILFIKWICLIDSNWPL